MRYVILILCFLFWNYVCGFLIVQRLRSLNTTYITPVILSEYMGGIRIVDSNEEMDENHWSVIMKNEYKERLANKTIEELVDNFNSDQPSQGWVTARGYFLAALRQAFLDSEIDCSSFISEKGMSLQYQIRLEGNIIFQVKDN